AGLSEASTEPRVQIGATVVVDVLPRAVRRDQLQERIPAAEQEPVEGQGHPFAGDAIERILVGLATGDEATFHHVAEGELAGAYGDRHGGGEYAAAWCRG